MHISTRSINYWLSQTCDQGAEATRSGLGLIQQTIPAICRGSLTCSPSNKKLRASRTDLACLFPTVNLITKALGTNTKQQQRYYTLTDPYGHCTSPRTQPRSSPSLRIPQTEPKTQNSTKQGPAATSPPRLTATSKSVSLSSR